jgi:RNA polymerase sigma-70 factor (ECF subfamily)
VTWAIGRDEERSLVLACQRGETRAFAQLVQLYQDAAVRTAYLMTGDRQAAEDVAQNAFLNAFRHLHRFDPERPFRPWFFGILANEARMHRRWLRRRPTAPLDPQTPEGSEANPLLDRVVGDDERARVRRALADLAEPFRTAVVLYYFDDLSVEEVASAMDCRVGTVKSRLHTARARLREALAPFAPTRPAVATAEHRPAGSAGGAGGEPAAQHAWTIANDAS